MTHEAIHASEHTNGTDDIQDATAGQKGLATSAQIGKLDGIDPNAVDAAGAVAAMGVKADGNPLNHDRPIQATETVVGIAEIATQAETDTGTDDTKMITPKKLAASPSAPKIIQDSSVTEFSTTNVAWTQAKRFTKTTLAAKYLVQAFCEIYQTPKDKTVLTQVQIDDTTHVLQCHSTPSHVDTEDEPTCASGFVFVTLTAAAHNFDFDIMAGSAGGTAKAKNFRIVLMKVVE